MPIKALAIPKEKQILKAVFLNAMKGTLFISVP